MVRQVTTKHGGSWKALLAISVATGGLLWHLLACTESPMTFSPDGKNLAFVTVEPYDEHDYLTAGSHAYRLMILSENKPLRVIEETANFMLSGPGYSPDGKRLCYVRIPLLTKERVELLVEIIKMRTKNFDGFDSFSWSTEPEPPKNIATEAPASQTSPHVDSLMMPSFEASMELAKREITNCKVPAVLIVRDTETGDVVSTTPFEWPLSDKPDESLLMNYLTIRPQYASDGKWVYLCVGDMVMAVNPSSGDRRVYALAADGLLSPDGETVAVLVESAVGFIRTDGQAVTYRRLEGELSRSGLAWVATDKLAVLARMKDAEGKDVLHFLRTDGTIVASQTLPLPEHEHRDENMGELAIAPDGAHMVLAYGKDVFFINRDGSVRRHWRGDEGQLMAQPKFAPNSKRIAMKVLKEEDSFRRVIAIVFFTPAGEEVSRTVVPKTNLALIRPASPSTQPAEQGPNGPG
jgi:hypothetical protein